MQANRSTRLKRILEEIKEEDGEADIREKMQMLSLQLIDSISNLHQVFTNRIFIAICRGFWDRMGQVEKTPGYENEDIVTISHAISFILTQIQFVLLLDCSEVS